MRGRGFKRNSNFFKKKSKDLMFFWVLKMHLMFDGRGGKNYITRGYGGVQKSLKIDYVINHLMLMAELSSLAQNWQICI